MAYDAMAGYIYQIDQDVIAESIPDIFQKFLEVLERLEITTDTLGSAFDCDEFEMLGVDEEHYDSIEDSYNLVLRTFEAKTGLQVALTTIDPGSAYNEVVGPAWHVLNATRPTLAAERFSDHIEQKFFCHFG